MLKLALHLPILGDLSVTIGHDPADDFDGPDEATSLLVLAPDADAHTAERALDLALVEADYTPN